MSKNNKNVLNYENMKKEFADLDISSLENNGHKFVSQRPLKGYVVDSTKDLSEKDEKDYLTTLQSLYPE